MIMMMSLVGQIQFSLGTINEYYDKVGSYVCPKSVVIPKKIDDKNVTTIGFQSFGQKELIKVIISNGINTIEPQAFTDNNLVSIKIPSSVTTIGESAFGLNKLTSVIINKNKDTSILGYDAFGWVEGYSDDNICWLDDCD